MKHAGNFIATTAAAVSIVAVLVVLLFALYIAG
jgi:hypothetical protein